VLFECDEAVSPSHHEDFVEELEKIEELLLPGVLSTQCALGFVQNLLENVSRARDHKHANGDASDNDELRNVEQHQRRATREHEAPDGRREDDESSD
jgi:hypothetical protein